MSRTVLRRCSLTGSLLALAMIAAPAASAGPAEPGKAVPTVGVASVTRKAATPSLTFTGRIEAVAKVELRARVDGYLEQREFTEGGEVKAGDLLFVIEKGPYEAQLAQIEASIEAASAALRLAQLELDRKVELLRKQVVAQAQVDDVRAKHDEAQAALLRQKAAAMEATLNLGYTEIRAPVSGQIGRAAFSVGNYVGPSSGTLATLVSRDPIYATFPVSQRELIAVRQKAVETGADMRAITVRLQLADGSSYREVGKLDFVDVTMSRETDTVLVRAEFPNPDRLLIDGQLVTVHVELATGETALFVPQQALQFDQTGFYVLVVDKENRVKIRRITLGEGREGEVEVKSGLAEEERVIIDGVQKVRPDQVVEVTAAAAGTPR
ncbi:MAG: efflux RND transporter periplasmic adaptor subunit [Rhodospirillales bacterium]|nr:efflux RND transporter periplasmic adaptor subunit [Rhodospirillales bacterium]